MPEPPRTPAWESAAIILAILALWPKLIERAYAAHWPAADLLLVLALAAMCLVLVRKILRFRKLWNPAQKE